MAFREADGYRIGSVGNVGEAGDLKREAGVREQWVTCPFSEFSRMAIREFFRRPKDGTNFVTIRDISMPALSSSASAGT